jgi:outer membrane protein assembly factor BamA
MLTVRLRRGTVATELLILALTGLLGLGGAALLSSRTVRQAALEQLGRTVEQRLGVALSADDFRWDPRHDRLEILGLRLGAPGERPAFSARRLTLGVRLLDVLLGEAIELRSLDVEASVLDLTAPLPQLASEGDGAGGDGRPIEVGRLSVRGGRVVGGALGGPQPWLSGWGAEDLTASGSLRDGRLRLDLTGVDVVAQRGEHRLATRWSGLAQGPVIGPWTIERLAVRGEGLEADLSGVVGFTEGDPLRATFRLEASSGVFAREAGRATGGRFRAEGWLDLAAESGRVSWNLEGFPGELAVDFVPSLPPAVATLTVDSDGDLEIGPGQFLRATGRLGATLSQRGEVVARLAAHPSAPSGDLSIPLEIEIFPGAGGSRRFSGTLELSDPGALTAAEWLSEVGRTGRWRGGRATIDEPDLATRWRRLAEILPQLALPEGAAVPAGRLRLDGEFEGPLLDPRVDLRGDAVSSVFSLRLAGQGRPASGTGRIEVTADRVELPLPGLAGVAGQVSGQVSGTLRAERSEGGDLRGSTQLAAPRLVVGADPATATELTDLEIEAELGGGRLRVSRLSGVSGPFRASGSGEVALADPMRPLPVAGGRLDLTVEHDDSPLGAVPLVVTLEAGVVRIEGEEIRARGVGGAAGWVRASVPLAALEPLVGREALAWAALPKVAGRRMVSAEWSLPEVDWAAVVRALAGPETRVERLVAALDGRLEIDPYQPLDGTAELVIRHARGRLLDRDLEAEGPIVARLGGGMLELDLLQVLSQPDEGPAETLTARGSASLESGWKPGAPLAEAVRWVDADGTADLPAAVVMPFLPTGSAAVGRFSVFLAATGPPSDLEAEIWLEGPEAAWRLTEPAVELRAPSVTAAYAGSRIAIDDLRLEANGLPIAVRGWLESEGEALRARLESVAIAGCEGGLEVSVPSAWLSGGDEGSAPRSGAVSALWSVLPCDWTPLLIASGTGFDAALRGGVAGSLALDLARPAAAAGEVGIDGLAVDLAGREVRSVAPLRLRFEGGAVDLEPFELSVAGQPLAVEGHADLDPAWTLSRPVADLVRWLSFDARGRVLAELVQPFFGNGRASGAVDVDIHLEGPPRQLAGRLIAKGPEASIALFSPYFTRIEAPDIEAELIDGALVLRRGRLTLNEGPVDLSGELDLDGAVDLRLAFDDVRYRLDYGLLASLGGRLRWSGDLAGESTISGSVTLDRGLLTRPIEMDREFLLALLSPVDLSGTSGGWFERIALDLEVATGEGVRVRNNLADLLVRWEPLEVGGTLAFPLIRGVVEVDSGGVVRIFNQAIRLERAALTYTGEPGAEPLLDLVTTDSAADPSIESIARQGAGTAVEGVDYEALGESVATFLGGPAIGRLGEALGGAEIQVESVVPVAVFGEADPSARLNVQRDFSSRVAVVASIDLRNAERQTYILDLHDLPGFSSLAAQAFTLDDGEEGGSFYQSLELGGGGGVTERGPRIRKLTIERPAGILRRAMKRAVAVGKGDPLPPGGAFALEVEIFEYLRRRGYMDPKVRVTEVPTDDPPGVEVEVGIEPGPRAAFRFSGARPPARLRESITSLYRPDPFEQPTLEEMRVQTVRVFRSRGHLHPVVTLEARPAGSDEERFDRIVEVTTEEGPRVELTAPRFEGLPGEESSWVARRFWGPVQRAELALGLAEADARALQAMRELGYVEPVVEGRDLVEGDLAVRVDPGARQRVASVEILGLPSEIPVEPSLEPGDPLRYDRVGSATVEIQRRLQGAGYVDAVVRSRLEPGGDPLQVGVRFDVEPGESYRLGDVVLEGVVATRPEWVSSVAALEVGEPVVGDDLQSAQRRLYATDLFSRVSYRIERLESGLAAVALEIEERPRFRVAYGLRWDTAEGASALFEAEDRNFLGRNLDLAFRGLWAGEDFSARGLLGVPRLFRTRGSLDLFSLLSRQVDDGLIRDRVETTLQFSFPLSSLFTGRAYVRYRDDEIREVEPDPFFPIMERIRSPLVGLQLLYDDRASRTQPSEGFFGSIDLSGADDRIGGDFRYLRLFAQLHWYRPLGEVASRPVTWAQSYRFGVAEPLDDQDLIFQNRFFAGGEYSVRGYDRDSLGPQEQLGSITRPAGGEALMVLNQELRVRVNGTFTGLFFADFGNVWASKGDFGSELVSALGVGLRATTPLGLLRLDFAHPLDRRPEDSTWRVHFGLGNVF